MSTLAAVQVNLPTSFDFFELRKQAADDNFFGQLLCITQSSNPKLSDDFPGRSLLPPRSHGKGTCWCVGLGRPQLLIFCFCAVLWQIDA